MYLGGDPGKRRDIADQNVNLSDVGGEDITLGQKLKSQSIPVVFATDQELSFTAEGTFVTDSEYAEDSPHTSSDVGMFQLGVRKDDPFGADATSANGNYSPYSVDAKGRLWVNDPYMQWRSLRQMDAAPGMRLKIDQSLGTVYKYIGRAPAGTLEITAAWEIMRLEYTATGLLGDDEILDIQMLTGVSWTTRVAAGWV